MANPITADKIPYGVPARGQIQEWADGRKFVGVYYDGAAPGATIAKGQPISIGWDDALGLLNPAMITAVNTSAVYVTVGIVCEARALATLGVVWVQTAHDCDFALVDGTTDVAAGDYLKLAASGTALISDGTSHTADSVAIARELWATDSVAAKLVHLLGFQVQTS